MTIPYFKSIAAMSLNRVIGKDNALPWNIPAELEWFKKMTLDQIILMGRKTFESIGKPLPRRESVVLSKSISNIKGATVIQNLENLADYPIDPQKSIWVIGGAEIYKLTLPYTSDLYLTEVKLEIPNGDAFFPPFENQFELIKIIEDNPQYRIIHYKNKSPLTLKK